MPLGMASTYILRVLYHDHKVQSVHMTVRLCLGTTAIFHSSSKHFQLAQLPIIPTWVYVILNSKYYACTYIIWKVTINLES